MAGLEKLITNGAQILSHAVQKSSSSVQVASEPIEKGALKLVNALEGMAVNNSALVKKTSYLADETAELLEGFVKKPINQDLSNLSPKNLVLVHATDFFPENGIIKTTANASFEQTGLINPRFKIHSALNHFVQSHTGGNWNRKKYSVLMPLDGIMETVPKENILGGNLVDFFIQGDVKLPKGSVIIKTGCSDIPWRKIKVSDFSPNGEIKLIETSRYDISNFTNSIIEKTGYSRLNPLLDVGSMASNPKMKKNDYEAWVEFAKKYGFENAFHAYSPWGRSETILSNIETLQELDNNWVVGKINHKEKILQAIEEIKKSLPQGRKLDYDIDELSDIVKNSKTPQEANELLEKRLKLKHAKLSFNAEERAVFENIKAHLILSDSKNMQEAQEKIKKSCPNTSDELIKQFNEILRVDCENDFKDLQSSIDTDIIVRLFLPGVYLPYDNRGIAEVLDLV